MSRISRLAHYELYQQDGYNWEKHIMPYQEIENFVNNSSDVNDIGLTLINYSEDEKYHILNFYNAKGIVNKIKKRKTSK